MVKYILTYIILTVKGGQSMKKQHNRRIRMQNRIIVSALLLVLQLAFLFFIIYDSSLYSVWGFTTSMFIGVITAIFIISKFNCK